MILYHGSNTDIRQVDFMRCRPYKDFGRGFYLTEIETQAVLMARRTAAIYGGRAVVSSFRFDETGALSDPALSIKRFETPNEEWALFVMANRSREREQPTHAYDIVIGPVADDAIAVLFRNFADGIIDLPTLVQGLRYREVSSQYFFHTVRACRYLSRL